ncbi:MAG: hypothetical protein OEU74_07450 [Gammaproteobacteria bacterium]|nr:hypothetical protein [Gammaproteobacteria bacterium]
MSVQFSPEPGPHERQLRRKYHNPLFAEAGEGITQQELEIARQQDQSELRQFLEDFQSLVQDAVDLKPNTDSQLILDMKERLDQSYTRCCAMPGDHPEIKTAINQLIQVIMKAVRQGAVNDPVALSKLDEEDMARQTHQQLHAHTLIVDLLLADSPISETELLPTLLSETPEAVQSTLQLFDAQQLRLLYDTGKSQLEELQANGHDLPAAWANLALLENALLDTANTPMN